MKKILLLLFITIFQLYAYSIKDVLSCSKGDPLACDHVGQMFQYGYNTKENPEKAKQYYEKSCNLKYGAGCNDLAKILKKEQKYQRASKYYFAGCQFNHADACSDLALLFKEGKGVRVNYTKAKRYYKKACILGDNTSCSSYAYLDRNGI